ncbi:uncharacterized protein VTP21DRAFT_6271 [Calcarisporiella thermophila]|uniref:uncharacterized protein n=1 Tax=Calcarisporiella thermophila TaxID=911321 RepID=UPI0037428B41
MSLDAFVANIRTQFTLDRDQLERVVAGLTGELMHGLSARGNTQNPSYITSLPHGNETGTYLAIDVGGSNLRVAAVQLLGEGRVEVVQHKHSILDSVKTGSAENLFGWIVEKTEALLQQIRAAGKHEDQYQMGVVWSFPLEQTGVNKGAILEMGKGFTVVNEILGLDLGEQLQKGFDAKGLPIRVSALLNDTVGTLVAHAYQNPLTTVGIIFGTGTNAAYIERTQNIPKLKECADLVTDPSSDRMILNTEWDIFGSAEYLPLTKYDVELDKESTIPGFQAFEKMCSGMYLGEITRRVLIDAVKQGLLFSGNVPAGFEKAFQFQTAFMSTIESDVSEELSTTRQLLEENFRFEQSPALKDLQVVREIVRIIGDRSANLLGAATVSLLRREEEIGIIGQEGPIVLGITGSLYELYPNFEERTRRSIITLLGQEKNDRIEIGIAMDGGCVGAAIAAMLGSKK